MNVSHISGLLSAIYDTRNAYAESERTHAARAQNLGAELSKLKSEARETNEKLALDLKTARNNAEQLESEMQQAKQCHSEALDKAEARHWTELHVIKACLTAMESGKNFAENSVGQLQGQLTASAL